MAVAEPTWAEMLGSNNWESLLEPLNLSLRRLILRCGDLCQATYDAFNNDQNSKYCGSSRYGKSSFFQKVMFDDPAGADTSDFSVASFIYATALVSVPEAFLLHSLSHESWDRESNWMGYIAVASDQTTQKRRQIYVVWRGTTTDYEWINVLGAKLKSVKPLLRPEAKISGSKTEQNSSSSSDSDDEKNPKVMLGWLTIYTSDNPNSPFTKSSARTQLLAKIKELKEQYQNEEISITCVGHSLGASLAVLGAFDIVENGIVSDNTSVSAFVFGCPQIGNKAFNERMKKYPNLKILHIKNKIDLIPHYPGHLLGYVYSGTELVIDTRKSTSLKESTNPADWHNLQAMLHVVAGWNGEKGKFEMKVKRSLALVNKSSAFLKDELMIPGSWWVEMNKGMVRNEDGEWVLASPSDDDLPVHDF